MNKAERLRTRAAAAAITLLSGAVMMFAGYVGHTDCWAIAGFITTPGGILILGALALARRVESPDSHQLARTGSHQLARTDSHRARRVDVMAAVLLSGGVMVLAGYTGSAWGWGLAAPLAIVGGLVVGVAFALDRRRTQTRVW